VCQSGLPTFIPPVIKLSKIHAILEKGNQPNERNKKEYDVFHKCKRLKQYNFCGLKWWRMILVKSIESSALFV
jgi:hypothetical protein